MSSFTVEGRPAATGAEAFEEYGSDGTVQTLTPTGFGKESVPASAERCDFWFESAYR